MTWMRGMMCWIGALRRRNGFYTPATFHGGVPEGFAVTKGDFLLAKCFTPVRSICRAAEAVRKGDYNTFRLCVQQAYEDLESLGAKCMKPEDIAGELPTGMTNCEAMAAKFMLVVTELDEAQEDAENNNRRGFGEELADAQIRLNDIYDATAVDIESEVMEKMGKNEQRPPKHGKLTNL
jgi:hypothetical protein